MYSPEKVCGILGGMGPEATVDLLSRIIAWTEAGDDFEHVHCIVDQNPKIPSRIKAIIEKTGESPEEALKEGAIKLERAGADFLAIACNTAHNWHGPIQSTVELPVLHMPELAVKEASSLSPGGACALLASPAIQMTGLFEPFLSKYGLKAIYPDPKNRDKLLEIIKIIKAGRQSEDTREQFKQIAGDMRRAGADALIVACTELSALGKPKGLGIPIIDAADSLAKEIVIQAGGKVKQFVNM